MASARLALAGALVSLAAAACASIGGTADRSRTTARAGAPGPLDSVAVLAVPENAAAEGLARSLEAGLVRTLRAGLPGTRVVAPDEFAAALRRGRGYLEHFARWRSTYETTSYLDPRPVPYYGRAAGVAYLLLVRSTHLDREKVSVKDAMQAVPCRRAFCTVSNPDNLWATKLKATAELVSVANGAVVWRGVGGAEHVQQGGRDLDFGVVVVHGGKGEDVEAVAAEMVGLVAGGIVREATGAALAAVEIRAGD